MTEIMPVPRNSHITVLRPPSITASGFLISAAIPVNRTPLIFFAIIGVAGVLHLRIIGGKVLAAELADILVIVVATEAALADVVQIITASHDVFLLVEIKSVWLASAA